MRAGCFGWQPVAYHSELTHKPLACRQFLKLPSRQQQGSYLRQELHNTRTSTQYGRRPLLIRASLQHNTQLQDNQRPACLCRGRARQKHSRHTVAQAFWWQNKDEVSLPKDVWEVTEQEYDIIQSERKRAKAQDKRIKAAGPAFQDLFIDDPDDTDWELPSESELEEAMDDVEDLIGYQPGYQHVDAYMNPDQYVPIDVLGPVKQEPEPKWNRLPRMIYREFYYGLQQRNWTSKHYDPSVEPWDLKFFRDVGMARFEGYRVLLTKPDGSQMRVHLPECGSDHHLNTHLQAVTSGSSEHEDKLWGTLVRTNFFEPETEYEPWTNKPLSFVQYGYNQIFEQLFQAFEQQVPAHVKEQYWRTWQMNPDDDKYSCPGDKSLSFSFHLGEEPKEYFKWVPRFAQKVYWGITEPFRHRLPYLWPVPVAFAFVIYLGLVRKPDVIPEDLQAAKEYAQSKAKARKEGMTDVRFSDVAGLDHVIDRLQQMVTFLRNPTDERFTRLARPPKGVLLEGDPGVGKTLIAKAVAGEAGVPFFQMSGSEFVEAIVGVGAARVRDLFKRAAAQKRPCIIFVDEIDSLGAKRSTLGESTNEEREQTLNQLLTEMDGFASSTGVLFMAATNRSDALDAALTRPGRFDWIVPVAKPNQAARVDILKVHTRTKPLADDVDLVQVAKDLPGLSGAELANVMNEAALSAIKRGSNTIAMKDIYGSMDRVTLGLRRPRLSEQSEAKKGFAVYEVGKGIVGTLLREQTGRLEAVDRVSLVPRGRFAWSSTTFLRADDEYYTMSTRGRMMERLQVMLAGRAAEEVAFNSPTTYSLNDIEDASRLALKMVTDYGLSDFGITTYAPNAGARRMSYQMDEDAIDQNLFRTPIGQAPYNPCSETWTAIKCQAYTLVTEAYNKNLEVLRRHNNALRQGALELLRIDTLTGPALKDIMDKNPPTDGNQQVGPFFGGGGGGNPSGSNAPTPILAGSSS